MVRGCQVAKDVRVVLNSNFEINSLSDRYLVCESILYISENHIYNDAKGNYVYITGGSRTNSGAVYLNEIDLAFPIDDKPLYSHSEIDYEQDLSKFKNNLI